MEEEYSLPENANDLPMSNLPSGAANWYWDDEWVESDRVCPSCQDVLMWQAGWYDGTPENGGARIGTKFECGDCEHFERE